MKFKALLSVQMAGILPADGYDGNVIVWLLDVATRTAVRGTYVHDDANNINSIAYSADGRYVAVAIDLRWAYLWDLNRGERKGWGWTDASEVYDVAFSPDGRYLATGNDNGDLTLRELNTWWTDDVTTIHFKPGGNVQSVAFSPDGRYLAADGYDGSNTYVNIYNVGTGRVAWQINSGAVNAIVFSPSGEYIALGDTDGVITFYRIGTNPTHVAEMTARDTVYDLAWSPDGTMISDGRDVWNVNKASAPIAAATGNKIYWVDFSDGKILRSNLDGSDVEVVLSGLSSPTGIAVDATGDKLYWTDEGTDKIQCANLDGSNVQELIYIKDVRSPTDIALNVDAGKMYWIQTFLFSSEIWCANLSGSNPQRILRTSLDSLEDIALDVAGGKIYWSQTGFLASNKIRRANFDGSNVQTLFTGGDIPSGIALNGNAGKMYWTDSREHKIQRANLDGSNVQTLVTNGLDTPSDISLDATDGKMYWVERRGGKIRRANFDGSNVQTLVSGLSHPYGIALDSNAEVVPAAPSNATVKLSPVSVESPEIGEQLTFSLDIADGENVSGYQATIQFDTTALKYVQSANGNYLPDGAFFIPPIVEGNNVQLAASSLAGKSNGDGMLATITFEVVAMKASTVQLANVLLTDSSAGSSTPEIENAEITESAQIGIVFPDNFITEKAFGTNSTYFIVNAQYPMLTGISDADILYGSCIITLHIPDNVQGFVFPIKTKEEELQDASIDLIISLGINIIPFGGTLVDVLNLFSKANDLQNRDLKIELHTSPRHREPPETVTECIVLLKHPENERPNGIDITIEQQYRDTDRGSTRIDKVDETKRWIFDDGWAAPAAQVPVFDYPPFQLLPAEVQQFLQHQFSEFGTMEIGLAPKETTLLANYPNPFNPETWIPYQLAAPAHVTVTIYAVDDTLVRTLALGHKPIGIYQSRTRAAYWDGKNDVGEPVASGVYFYTLSAGDFTATRKMLIKK